MMGSATAMLTGATSASATTLASGEAPASGDGGGFLAALGALLPGDSPLADAAGGATGSKEDAPAGDAAFIDLAALVAAMLQPTPAAGDAGTDAAADAGEGVPDGAAPLPGNDAAKLAVLANLRMATSLDAAAEPAATDAPESAEPFIATLANAVDDKTAKSGTPNGMRQLLQLLAPHGSAAGAATHDASTADRAAPAPATYAAPAELLRRAVDVAAAATRGTPSTELAASSAPAQPVAATPEPGVAAANLAAPAHPSRAAAAAPELPLQSPVGTPRWADELGSRLVLMSLRGQHEGSLNLTPEHLGPLEVRVSVNQNTANVWFGSQHADTRAALAEAMPRLRELMAGAGLTLGQTNVSHQAPRQGSREAEVARIGAARSAAPVAGADDAAAPAARRIALGLVDTYV